MLDDVAGRFSLNADFVRAVCDRHFGVGADGVIRVGPADDADFFMDYWNADGTVAEMCGNGVRCIAKFVADRGLHRGDIVRIGTRGGVKEVAIERGADGTVARARVDMGEPVWDRARIPLAGEGDPLHEKIETGGYAFEAACISMGNPHCVLFVDSIAALPFEDLGPAIETMDRFPAKTNVEFVEVRSDGAVNVRVWERGVGETLACGTGACAVAAAAALRGLTGRTVAVSLPGGTLDIDWTPEGRILMTGPAVEVFEGELSPAVAALIER